MRIVVLQNSELDEDAGRALPLCVDLDGTLIKSDSLFDAVCLLLRSNPVRAWRLPFWLAGGRARLKSEIAQQAPLDVARLPYNAPLLSFLQDECRQGRQLYLTTGADAALAERVAAHLGIFQGVLASDGATNLTSGKKLELLKLRFGSFDYIGNSRADLPLLLDAAPRDAGQPHTRPVRCSALAPYSGGPRLSGSQAPAPHPRQSYPRSPVG